MSQAAGGCFVEGRRPARSGKRSSRSALSAPSSSKGCQGVPHLSTSLQDSPQGNAPYGSAQGRKFPCEKCRKILVSRSMLRVHVPTCMQGRRVHCPDCDQSLASQQGMKQHFRVMHGPEAPNRDKSFLCLHCAKAFSVKKSMWEHSGVCVVNLDGKGHFTAGYLAAPLPNTPSPT